MVNITFKKEKVNPVYRPYINTNNPYEIYWGGGGSGKSFFIAQKNLIKCLGSRRYRLVFSRKQAVDIRDSQFLLFKDLIESYKLQPLFHVKESSMDIMCVNGNSMLAAGMDDPEKIKSIQKPTDIWMEEITEFDYEDFEQFDLRLRGEAGETRQLFASFNPINEEHWVKKELFDKPLKNGKYVHTTYKDNQHIDQREYEEKLNRMSPHNQRIYKEGKWGLLRTGMEFYPAFDAMVHVSDKALYEPDSAIHLTFDMNVNPYMTLLVNQIRFMPETKRVRVTQIDEICLPHPLNKTRYVCERFMRDYADHNAGLFYYGDATSKKGNTMTEDEVKHDYDIVENVCRRKLNNGSFRVNKANPPVLKRKDFMDDLFRGNTAIDYLIHPKCKNTINDYLYLKEGADGKKFKEKEENKITGAKFEKYGHCSDAEEYFFCYAFENIMRQYERR